MRPFNSYPEHVRAQMMMAAEAAVIGDVPYHEFIEKDKYRFGYDSEYALQYAYVSASKKQTALTGRANILKKIREQAGPSVSAGESIYRFKYRIARDFGDDYMTVAADIWQEVNAERARHSQKQLMHAKSYGMGRMRVMQTFNDLIVIDDLGVANPEDLTSYFNDHVRQAIEHLNKSPSQSVKEKENTMELNRDFSRVDMITLLQLENIQFARCVFERGGRQYSYKVPKDWNVQADSLLVVPSQNFIGFSVVHVVAVVDGIDEELKENIDYKWAVSKVDTAAYVKQAEEEDAWEARLIAAKKADARKAALSLLKSANELQAAGEVPLLIVAEKKEEAN